MTNAQMWFYGCALLGMAALWFFTLTLMRVKDWKKIANKVKDGAKWVGMMAFFSAAFVAVVVPVYILTRLSDGIHAFLDAAFPELSGLVYRVRYTARAHAEQRLARWNKSVAYDREDHQRTMAEFDDADDVEENYASAGASADSTYW
jgi:hypothetical protein